MRKSVIHDAEYELRIVGEVWMQFNTLGSGSWNINKRPTSSFFYEGGKSLKIKKKLKNGKKWFE